MREAFRCELCAPYPCCCVMNEGELRDELRFHRARNAVLEEKVRPGWRKAKEAGQDAPALPPP